MASAQGPCVSSPTLQINPLAIQHLRGLAQLPRESPPQRGQPSCPPGRARARADRHHDAQRVRGPHGQPNAAWEKWLEVSHRPRSLA
eukprot:6946815-Pyramimonas_sp.AAC.1